MTLLATQAQGNARLRLEPGGRDRFAAGFAQAVDAAFDPVEGVADFFREALFAERDGRIDLEGFEIGGAVGSGEITGGASFFELILVGTMSGLETGQLFFEKAAIRGE